MQTLNGNGVKVSLTMVVEATWKMHCLRNFVLSFVKLTNTLQYLELTKSEKDFTALKAQSEGLSKEYDRLLEEYTQTKVRIRSVAGGIYPNKAFPNRVLFATGGLFMGESFGINQIV